MDIISLPPLKSLGFNPNTLIKVQIKATSAVKGFMLDIEGGIFLSVRSPDHSNHLKAVCLFYVAGNVSQNYLSCPFLRALFVVGKDFPRTGTTTSDTHQPIIQTAQAQERCSRTQCPRTTHSDSAPKGNAAYAPRQFRPRTPRTPSCSSKSPRNCPVKTLGPRAREIINQPRISLTNKPRKSTDTCKTQPTPTQQTTGLETTANTGDQDAAAITQPKNMDAAISTTPIAGMSMTSGHTTRIAWRCLTLLLQPRTSTETTGGQNSQARQQKDSSQAARDPKAPSTRRQSS